MRFREYKHWSVVLGCDAVRLSIFDDKGQEYFCLFPMPVGPGYRQIRADKLLLLEEALEAGLDPGEVVSWPN
jgi:hypothetical protein